MEFSVSDQALAILRPLFTKIEGDCEPWADDEIVRRTLIRGAMEYARSGGAAFREMSATAAELRSALGG